MKTEEEIRNLRKEYERRLKHVTRDSDYHRCYREILRVLDLILEDIT